MPQENMMPSSTTLFDQAISLQQGKKPDEALALYQKILDQGPTASLTVEQGSAVSHNIAVIYSQLQQFDQAYIFNQKALALNPRNSYALDFQKGEMLKGFKPETVVREAGVTDYVNNLGFRLVPLEALGLSIFVFFFLGLREIFKLLIERKRAAIENTETPKTPWKVYIYSGLFIILGLLISLKWEQDHRLLAMIKSSSASVQAAPGPNQAVITDIGLGNTVEVLQARQIEGVSYVRIKVPGSYGGWLKKAELELLNRLAWPANF